MFIYRIETKQGFIKHDFESLKMAEDYVMGFLSWSGTKYRIHRVRR